MLLGAAALPACGGPAAEREAADSVPASSPTAAEAPLRLILETDREVYARGDPVTLTLTLTNRGDEPVILEFADAQRYDLRILSAAGDTLWRWSEDVAFAQVLGEERLAPGESREWRERHDGRLPPGEYRARGIVPATGRPLEAGTSFRVHPE